MTQELIPILHTGRKPDWLERDALVWRLGTNGRSRASAASWAWREGQRLSLPTDHWAAPVLRLGGLWTPWNPKLQGDGPPADYVGGKVMLRRSHYQVDLDYPVWGWDGGEGDIIGYERAEPQPAAEPVEYLIRKGGYFYRSNAQGYTVSKAEAGRYSLEEAVSLTHPNGANGPRDELSYEPAPPSTEALLEKAVEALERTRSALRLLQPALNVMARECLDDIIAREIDTTLAEIEKERGR